MPALTIPIHDLDNAGRDYVFALDESWLRDAFGSTGVRGDASLGGGQVEVHAQLNGREVLVHGKARARLVTECARCSKDMPVEVACELAALYAPDEAGRADKHRRAGADDEDDDIAVDPDAPDREFYSGDQVVIDDLVRDYLLLELPMQPRCDLGWSCPNLDVPEHMRSAHGVQSAKGFGEATVDPRLMPLKKLVKNEPEKE
jgi:uncharacterized metal-binding protein YceD (DUF177 family)